MKIVLLCVVALVMVAQLPTEGDAVCCHGRGFLWGARCADCSKASPYCSKDKPCNIFGCNCKGGCRTGPCQDAYNHAREMPAEMPVPVTEVEPVREYDTPYDSKPYGSPEYESPMSDVSEGSETDVPASTDYNMASSDVSEGSETDVPASPDYDMAASDVSAGSETVIPASSDYDMAASDVSAGSDTVIPASSDYDMAASEVSAGSDTVIPASSDYDMAASEVSAGSETDVPASSDDWGAGYNDASDIFSAEDVVSTADDNGDGLMDIEEAERFLVKRGIATSGYRAKRSLRSFDRNNDNFISPEEIEQYEADY